MLWLSPSLPGNRLAHHQWMFSNTCGESVILDWQIMCSLSFTFILPFSSGLLFFFFCCSCSNFNVKCIFFVRGHNIYCLSYCSPSPCDSFSHSFFLFFKHFHSWGHALKNMCLFLGIHLRHYCFLSHCFSLKTTVLPFLGYSHIFPYVCAANRCCSGIVEGPWYLYVFVIWPFFKTSARNYWADSFCHFISYSISLLVLCHVWEDFTPSINYLQQGGYVFGRLTIHLHLLYIDWGLQGHLDDSLV